VFKKSETSIQVAHSHARTLWVGVRSFTLLLPLFLTVLTLLSSPAKSELTLRQAGAGKSMQGLPIRSIQFRGDFKLRTYILHREIDSRVGQPYDSALVERDRKKIDGLGIFSEVEPVITDSNDSVNIDFELKEVWTLLPLLSISRTDDGFDWLVGASEKNLLGLYLRSAVFYRRFEGENSYGLSGSFPRAFGKDLALGWSVGESREVDRFATRDAETDSLMAADYRYLNKYISLSGGIRLSEKVYASTFVSYNRENWTVKNGQTTPPGLRKVYDFPRYSLGGGVTLGRVYYDDYFYEGADFGTALSLINEQPDGSFSKWRLGFVGRTYVLLGNFNLALRAVYQISSADERVMPYYISGSLNVRGFADKAERGDYFLGGNAEIRWRSFESRLFYTQLVAFTDVGSVWGRLHKFSDAISNPYFSVGCGVRLAIKRFLGNIGRADLAVNTKTGALEYYLSAYQFF
jgi:outer membrane protein assembly factor BamA